MRTITIQLSYTGDQVSAARIAKRAIMEISDAFVHQEIALRVVDWKDNVTTGAAGRPQEVINSQTANIHGIVAILGTRLGSSTGTHDSGVVEEVDRTRDKFGISNGRVHVLFKNSASDVNAIDPVELSRVVEYKKTLAASGILYGEFSQGSRLTKLVRQAVSKIIAEAGLSAISTPATQTPETKADALQKFKESRQALLETELGKAHPSLTSLLNVIETVGGLAEVFNDERLASLRGQDANQTVEFLQSADQRLAGAVVRLREDLDTIYSAILRQAAKFGPTDSVVARTGMFFLMALIELGTGVSAMVAETLREKAATLASIAHTDARVAYSKDRATKSIEELARIVEGTSQEFGALIQQIGWRVEIPSELSSDATPELLAVLGAALAAAESNSGSQTE